MAEPTIVEPALLPVAEALLEPAKPAGMNRRRLLALGVVLAVSFSQFIVTSFYYLFHAELAINRPYRQISVFGALLGELVSLSVLWFVLSEHKRTWSEIGWNPQWMDLLRGVGVILISGGAGRAVVMLFQSCVHALTGHYPQPSPVHGAISAGISVFSILLVVVNPFFEELIVRGYTMTEVVGLGGSRNFAIIVSMLIQMSYHVYQGLVHCVGLIAVFLVFSIYFSRTRRIAPVIVAHFWSDASALIRIGF
jgi:membrane protease YdiL (CAAX protease family)